MTDAEIQDALTGIYRRIFNAPAFVPRDGMSGRDVPNADSLSAIAFLLELQKVFRIAISALEAGQLETVADVRGLVARKLTEQGRRHA